MNTENLIYWLNGYLEDRDSLTKDEVQRVKDMITCGVVKIPPRKPSRDEVAEMIQKLFPDLKDLEFVQAIDRYYSKM